MVTADQLREKFLDFFKSKGHKIVSSDSLVPKDDPTVLFTPAGMNQFKREFLSLKPRFKSAATSQRCLRTDDLDKVGKTSAHHTLFEMLGNFSFGDYFKEGAIAYAWEFLTQVLKIDQDRLWVSIYKDDQQSYDIWKDQIKVPVKKIVKLGDKSNFWPSEAKEKGPNGPCGPCSEIFFDQGAEVGCKKSECNPDCDCDRFVEVWNLVFTQYNRKEGGELEPLPKKNIDTGMGLERLAAVMQGVPNNFETDLFQPIIKEIKEHPDFKENGDKGIIYAIADHLRAIAFAIFDGVLPSNEGRGYVVRKLIRKSILHLRACGVKEPYLYKLVPVLSEVMHAACPDLSGRRENISEVILAEEKNFANILDSSDSILDTVSTSSSCPTASGTAFVAYDTYGIPVEVSWDYLNKKGKTITDKDREEFNKKLKEQKERSKQASAISAEVFAIKDLDLDVKETKFLGYTKYDCSAKVLKIVKDGQEVKKIIEGDQARIVLDETVFYPESGGQVGDWGELVNGENLFEVTDTQKIDNVTIHHGVVKKGSFKESDQLRAQIDLTRRLSISRNHTATHILQSALREVLGPHVQQQGSLVAEDRLRFDFTHFKNINQQELARIEEVANDRILGNHSLETKEMTLEEAKKTGALAFFGEKYEDQVRVVSIGDFSQELCGGAHLDYTGQIGLLKIISESSIASGVRRIEAETGTYAYQTIKNEESVLDSISKLLVVPYEQVGQELEKRLSKIKKLEKELDFFKQIKDKEKAKEAINSPEKINDYNLIKCVIDDGDIGRLRKTVDFIKNKTSGDNIIIAGTGSTISMQAYFVVGITGELRNKIDASELVKEVAPEIGGSGGGRKDFAQAGGNKPKNLKNAFEKLKNILKGRL